MKKEATKKSKLWIWLVVGILLLLAVAGGVLALVLGGGGGEGDGPKGGRPDLYWNLDRATYTQNSESGLSTREPGEDGVYRVRYAYNGEVVEYSVADKQLVNFIDTMDCMGLVKDADGVVIDVVDPKTIATETARMFYVRSATDSVITLNSSMAMNGMTMEIALAEMTEVYDVAVNAENPGAIIKASALQPMDSVTVYSNDLGEPTHVYAISHPVESPVYWRADSGTYDSTLKQTTRVPDEDGYYTIPFYVNGEYVELKCNIQGIVNTIDNKNRFKAHTGLVLDENGYIVDNMLAATGIRGLLGCEMYDVIEVNGKTFTAEAQVTGKMDQYTKTLAADAKIYNVSLEAKPDVRGKEVDSLKVGDRIVTFENTEGEVIFVFIGQRLVDRPMYFNVTKKYDSTQKVTKRTPDSNGWYTIEMMDENGVISTFKTKDKDLMTYIDSQNNRSVALELNGDEITYAWPGECVAGYGAFVGYNITNVTGTILSMAPSSKPDSITNRIMTPDCKVFNMSGKNKGETTTPQVGDYCIMWRNAKSEINYIYVIRRLVDAPVYFSVTRKWDSTTETTKRVKDADGYYVYECIRLGGEKVTVKTASKTVANFLDSQGPQTFALKVGSNGVIYDYYETVATTGGSKAYLNTLVKRLDKLVLYNPSTDKTYTPKMAEDCKVYNFSPVVTKTRGERTTLRLEDNIQCYTNMKGEIAIILVRQRKADKRMAWNVEPQIKEITVEENGETVTKKVTARTPGSDGLYKVELAIDGKISTYKVSENAIHYMDSANGAVACTISNGVVVAAESAIYGPGVWTSAEAAHVATVLEVKSNSLVVKSSKSADPIEIPLNKKFVCYDVSGKAEFIGKAATPAVENYGRIYLNEQKEAMFFYVMKQNNAADPLKLYWNVNRQKDDNGSTRTPDADGWYYIDLSVEGEVKTFKTNNKKIIDYIDKGNGGATALTVDGDKITATASALEGYGVAAAGKSGTVVAIDGNKVTVSNSAGEFTVDLAADAKITDAVNGSTTLGQYTALQVGDNFRCYNNAAGEMLYVYVLSRSSSGAELPDVPPMPVIPVYDNSDLTLDADNKAVCPYCGGEPVVWTALEKITEATALEEGAHYYLAADITDNAAHYIVKKNCVHLNGHNITSTGRVFHVDNGSTNLLTVMGNGVVTGASTASGTANVAGATISVRGNLNLIGGTYKHVDSTLPTIIMAKPQQVMNIYEDVKIEGTDGTTGTNLYVMMGVVNMYGGEITGGTATPDGTTNGYGDNVYVHGWTGTAKAKAEFNMYGGTVDGGIYATKTTETFVLTVAGDAVITDNKGGLTLDSATEAKLTLGDLSETARIYVTGNGEISLASAKAAEFVNNQILPATSEITLKAVDGVIVASGMSEPVWVLAWVVDPQFDEATTSTTRTPDANGYYEVELSVDGETKTYKTKATGLIVDNQGGIDYVDQSGFKNRAIAICLTEEGSLEFTNALGATNNTGAKGAKVTTVTAIEGGVITGTGADYTGKVAATGKIFDVSPNATVEGEITELKVGDYGRFYTDASGDILYGYVYTRTAVVEPEPDTLDMNTVFEKANAMAAVFADGGEVEAECPACEKTVTWKPIPVINGATVKLESGHYYFAEDQIVTSNYYYTINSTSEDLEVCIHLNGKTFQNTGTGNSRSFYVDNGAKLTIMGSGNVSAGRAASTALYRCSSTLEAVGIDTVVNVCGGTWSKTSDALDVMGGRLRGNGALNIYNGTVINIGDVQGNALWAAGGHVNLYGGEINGNVQVMKYQKDTTTLQYPVDLNLAGTVVNGKVHYNTENGTELQTTVQGAPVIAELEVNEALPVQIGRLTKGADVKVTATGVFTTENPNLQLYVDAGLLSAKAAGKAVSVTDGVASIVDATAAKAYDNSDLVLDAGKAMCPWCGEVKEWTVLEKTTGSQNLETGKHYYFAADQLENTGRYNVPQGVTACVHLNGHNVTNTANRVFSVQRDAVLNIMGNGIVTGSNNSTATANAAAATISSNGDVNLIGGTYCRAETSTLPTILEARGTEKYIKIYDGVTITGGLSIAYGHTIVYGGSVDQLDVIGQDIAGTNAQCSATLLGGTAENVYIAARDPEGAYATYRLELIVGGTAKANVELAEGAKITISEDGMKKGAEITVTAADGAITAENANAAFYLSLDYFKAAQETKTITEKDGILSIG